MFSVELEWKSKKIDILLSTYNGEKYINYLLTSIANQTHENWNLIIRDDGSTDNTMDILQKFKSSFPNNVEIIKNHNENLGPCKSYSQLMECSRANYIMFCDQDDVWLSNKIEWTIRKMISLENNSSNKPFLVHTDLIVVGEDLQLISRSYMDYQNINPDFNEVNSLLVQNTVTGCSVMINKNLKDLSYPIPNAAIMHDWWIALVASLYSGLYYIDKPTLLYRQHENNNVGARKYSIFYMLTLIGKLKVSVSNILKQGEFLALTHRDKVSLYEHKILTSFMHLSQKSKTFRIKEMVKNRYRKQGFIRNLGFMLTVFFLKK